MNRMIVWYVAALALAVVIWRRGRRRWIAVLLTAVVAVNAVGDFLRRDRL